MLVAGSTWSKDGRHRAQAKNLAPRDTNGLQSPLEK
jgi:hypothetical protein